jgi:transposase
MSRLVTLYELGTKQVDIAKDLGVDKSTICKQLKQMKEGKTLQTLRNGRYGRKKLSTARGDQALKRLCLKNRFSTSKELCSQWSAATGTESSPRTVRRRLYDAGLKACKPLFKPLLNKKQRSARVVWAREHKNWSKEQWRQVIFSDESKINLQYSDAGSIVRRRPHEELLPECMHMSVKYPESCMIWGCFSARGIGRMEMIEGTVNAAYYERILRGGLLPTVWTQFPGDDFIFQDDSAPCHRARSVKKFLQDNKVPTLPWPGNSPDLNPIENLWAILKKKVNKKNPRTKLELKEAIIKVWYHEMDGTLERLVDSMPDRCLKVLKAKGFPTKY